MSRILLQLLVATCLLLPALAAVAQPITRVYRADARPPQEIFANGFHGRGSNMDLLAHALGESCEQTDPARASAWVSTSVRRDAAIAFAARSLEMFGASGPFQTMLIYAIRPDTSYLDVRGVMRRAVGAGQVGQQGYTAVQAHILDHLMYATAIGGEEEVVTHYVAPANIISAQYVYFNAFGDLVEGQVIANPDYRPLDTQASDFVADLQAFFPSASIRIGYGEGPDSNGSCSMSCDGAVGSASSRGTLAAAPALAQCEVRSGFTPLLLDIIND